MRPREACALQIHGQARRYRRPQRTQRTLPNLPTPRLRRPAPQNGTSTAERASPAPFAALLNM